jgi:hypothetical protein
MFWTRPESIRRVVSTSLITSGENNTLEKSYTSRVIGSEITTNNARKAAITLVKVVKHPVDCDMSTLLCTNTRFLVKIFQVFLLHRIKDSD